ncbi:MAG: putative ABC transporter permease [Porcipelethomonas sp.]
MAEKGRASAVYTNICTAAVLFTVCGVAGWIYETVLTSFLWGRFAERGFLHIPVLPIYGVFAFILLPVFRKHNGWLTVFFGGMIISTVMELLSSYIIEAVLHERLWSYSSWDFNFQGRISLYSSLIFGALSVLLMKAVYPGVKKFREKTSERVIRVVGISCAVIIVSDFVYTLVQK